MQPGRGGAVAAAQQAEAAIQFDGDLFDIHYFEACGSQFERQRDAFQLEADLQDSRGVLLIQIESGQGGFGPASEQVNCFIFQ